MKRTTTYQSLSLLLLSASVFMFSCKKDYQVAHTILPIVHYSYWIYDSVEGTHSANHFNISRTIAIQYDPNLDVCYMERITDPIGLMDTFDRSPYWKRGYTNRQDFKHRIIFNADTITIHYPPPPMTNPGNSGFRYTSGVKL